MDWHPLVVHFPIVLLPLGFLLDLFALVKKRVQWHALAYLLLLVGTALALAAVLSGNAAAEAYRGDSGVLEQLQRHEDLSTLALFIFIVLVLGRLPVQLQKRYAGWQIKVWIAVAGLGSGLLWLTGYYGGELVYEYGVGVR